MKSITWDVYKFEELSTHLLYEILHLRSKIFVVEQADIYLDADNKDQQATHIVGRIGSKIVAYSRAFSKGQEYKEQASFGRVLVDRGYRADGIGKALIAQTLGVLVSEKDVKISAQLYLLEFYQNLGFKITGEAYLDGSIEHIDMLLVRQKIHNNE